LTHFLFYFSKTKSIKYKWSGAAAAAAAATAGVEGKEQFDGCLAAIAFSFLPPSLPPSLAFHPREKQTQ
jgi:hypothetical protein